MIFYSFGGAEVEKAVIELLGFKLFRDSTAVPFMSPPNRIYGIIRSAKSFFLLFLPFIAGLP